MSLPGTRAAGTSQRLGFLRSGCPAVTWPAVRAVLHHHGGPGATLLAAGSDPESRAFVRTLAGLSAKPPKCHRS